ncbi:MAG: hypothetical protein AAFR74_00460 [Pseudomonadota bacterium]
MVLVNLATMTGGIGTLYRPYGFMGGAGLALGLSAANWILFFITIPAAWLALGFSIGQFPRKKIIAAAPYYRWSAIWGAILVGVTCSLFGAAASRPDYAL